MQVRESPRRTPPRSRLCRRLADEQRHVHVAVACRAQQRRARKDRLACVQGRQRAKGVSVQPASASTLMPRNGPRSRLCPRRSSRHRSHAFAETE
eukprot:4137299-Pleurochrysis_carterae.AAC.1